MSNRIDPNSWLHLDDGEGAQFSCMPALLSGGISILGPDNLENADSSKAQIMLTDEDALALADFLYKHHGNSRLAAVDAAVEELGLADRRYAAAKLREAFGR